MQMSQWRFARDLNIPVVDITAKSGIKAFAPEWENLMAYKRGEMDMTEYSQRYLHKLIVNFERDRQKWENITRERTFAVACYCRPGDFCHRHLFTCLLGTYLHSQGKQVLLMGELYPHPNNEHYYTRGSENGEGR